jgi:hypothetical protein
MAVAIPYEVGMVIRIDGLSIVGVYHDIVEDGRDDGEEEHAGDLGPGLVDPGVDALFVSGGPRDGEH